MKKKKISWVLALFLLVLLSGCTYTPQKERIRILDSFIYVDNTRFYTVVHKELYQSPTGISTFPNGGIPKINNQILYFFMCDINQKRCVETGRFSRNDLIDSGLMEPEYKLHLGGSNPISLYMQKSKDSKIIYTILENDINKGTIQYIAKNDLKNKKVSLHKYTVLPKNVTKGAKVDYKLSVYDDLIKIVPKDANYKSYKTIFTLEDKEGKINLKYVLN